MKDIKNIVSDLESLLNIKLDPTLFPYVKGNSVRIGRYVVRSNKKGFHKVYDSQDNILIAETFCKSSAVALAKTLAKGNSSQQCIIDIDKRIQKWYNDCVFYKHTMNVTKDELKRDIVSVRYDIAKHKTSTARKELDKYIYS